MERVNIGDRIRIVRMDDDGGRDAHARLNYGYTRGEIIFFRGMNDHNEKLTECAFLRILSVLALLAISLFVFQLIFDILNARKSALEVGCRICQ